MLPDNRGLSDEVLLAAEKAKPSSDPAYWAKKSCKRCYGRGIEGTQLTGSVRNEIACSCAVTKFMAWRADFIKNYK